MDVSRDQTAPHFIEAYRSCTIGIGRRPAEPVFRGLT
jgi:hypothetical protein